MGQVKELIVNIGASTKNLNKELGKARRDFGRTFGNIQKMGANLSKSVSLPLAALAGTSIKVFADFEQGMAKVKAVSGATGAEFQKLQEDAKRLGSATRFTATEVAGLQLEYSKLGFSTKETLNATEATLRLAQATDTDLARAAEVAGATLRAFGMDAAQTGHLTDVMAKSFSTSALDMEAFSNSMKFVAPVAKAAGVSVEETSAMLGVLADAGIKGSAAGTALRRIFSELSNDGTPLTEQFKKLSAQGLNLADAKDEVGRSAQSALLVLASGAEKIEPFTQALVDSEGAAADMAATMDATTTGQIKLMQSAIEGAQLAIGEALAPVITDITKKIATLANTFTNLNDGQQRTVIVIGALVGGIGPAIVAIGALIKNVKLIRAAMLLLNTTMLANPLLAVIAGVTALAGVMLTLKANTKTAVDETKDFIQELNGLDKAQQILAANQRLRDLEEEKHIIDRAKRLSEAQTQVGQLGDKFDRQISSFNASNYTTQVGHITDAITLLKKEIATITYGDGAIVDGLDPGKDPGGIGTGGTGGKNKGPDAKSFTAMVPLAMKPLQQIETQTGETLLKTRDYWAEYQEYLDTDVLPGLTEKFTALTDIISGFGQSFGATMAAVVTGTAPAGQALKSFALDALRAVISMAKANVIANATSPTNPANLASGGLTTPAFIVAGLSMLEGFLGAIPSLATGGLASSPQLAMVGDHANRSASNPEVIAPLDKLTGLMGGGNLSATISGRDILLVSSRDRNRSRRTFGTNSVT